MPRAFRTRRRVHSALGLLLEFALITTAVFLGLLADEWREERQQQQLAERTLERFRHEVAANSEAVQAVVQYHQELLQRVSAFIKSGDTSFQAFATTVQFRGIRPVIFESSAWDLAVASGSLGYIDPDLGFEISRVYTAQHRLDLLTQTFAQSGLAPTTFSGSNLTGLGVTMQAYLTDVTIQEPHLLELYAKLTADLDSADLAPAPANAATPSTTDRSTPN